MAFNKRGEDVVTAVLTEEKVRAIKALHAGKTRHRGEGLSCAALARAFGVSASQVHRILRGESWAHVRSI